MPETLVTLHLITRPEAWNLYYWTSYCRTVRDGRPIVLTDSDNSKEKLKAKVARELALLGQTPNFIEAV
jgi:hypothetical protein